MEKHSKGWLDAAKCDLRSAESLFRQRRYLYAMFVCNRGFEKLLRVCEEEFGSDDIPPYASSMRRVMQSARVEHSGRYLRFISGIAPPDFSSPDNPRAYGSQGLAQEHLNYLREFIRWTDERVTE